MPLIQVTSNWDGTKNLSLDGEPILTRKPAEEVEEKRLFLETQLLVRQLHDEEKDLTAPPSFGNIKSGGNTNETSQVTDEDGTGQPAGDGTPAL